MSYIQDALYGDVAQIQHPSLNVFGSGRLIGRNLVLTAGHVVMPRGPAVPEEKGWQVCMFAGDGNAPDGSKQTWIEAHVAWAGSGTLDLALLTLSPPEGVPDLRPRLKLRIAEIGQVVHHRVFALGFPRGGKVNNKRALFVASGELDNTGGDTLGFGIDQAYKPEVPDQDWLGFSGGAIVLAESDNDSVVWVYGVAQQVPPHFKGRLDVARLSNACADPHFCALLQHEDISLKPVDPIASRPPLPILSWRPPKPTDSQGNRMFPALPPAEFKEETLVKLGRAMTAGESEEVAEDQYDPRENTHISAGYTFLAQFIYNDLTFDPLGSPQSHADPTSASAKANPRFDLSCIYGSGPRSQPFSYDAFQTKFILGAQLHVGRGRVSFDVPRNKSGNPARAMIADARNDENVILSQLHAALLRFHNRFVFDNPHFKFEDAQRFVRFHYQWMILFDFLPTIIGFETLKSILPHLDKGTSIVQDPPQLRFYRPAGEPYIPIEFSGAAYRFGHSMIRPSYRLNRSVERLPSFPLAPLGHSLFGFHEPPGNWGIDWELFFPMSAKTPKFGTGRLQPSYKIDTSLVNQLGLLPVRIAQGQPSLAARNLLRGLQLKLPSGQAVARLMGIEPLPDDQLIVGPATETDTPTNIPISQISSEFQGNAPLWFYILAEAQQQFSIDNARIGLGPVGGRIVGEVFVGLLLEDPQSFLRQDPLFKPRMGRASQGNFTMADLLQRID